MTDDLFSYEQAIAERDAALRAVAAHADVDWKTVAREVVVELAQRGVPKTGRYVPSRRRHMSPIVEWVGDRDMA